MPSSLDDLPSLPPDGDSLAFDQQDDTPASVTPAKTRPQNRTRALGVTLVLDFTVLGCVIGRAPGGLAGGLIGQLLMEQEGDHFAQQAHGSPIIVVVAPLEAMKVAFIFVICLILGIMIGGPVVGVIAGFVALPLAMRFGCPLPDPDGRSRLSGLPSWTVVLLIFLTALVAPGAIFSLLGAINRVLGE